ANLSPSALAELRTRYEGTRLGRQELAGELIEDVEGSLWSTTMIDQHRVDEAPDLDRVVVGVDPAVTSGATSDSTGIVVCGCTGSGIERHFYVLADDTIRATPERWSSRVATTFAKWSADRVVVEVNQGGQLVEATLRAVGVNLPIRTVHASVSKR